MSKSTVSIRHAGSGPLSSAPAPMDEDETCPVCKTTRYFNRDMEFRINPECYHRMCKTCVERIFKDGPNQCPYAGCNKTLRLRGFKTAFFGDLTVEREVDIRRRVGAVFNKVEDDFETLDAYNDYLYMVECLTDDLVNGNDGARKKAEGQLQEWEAQHKAEIEKNKRLARETEDSRQKRLAAEQDAVRSRRMQEMQEEADEKASAARFREEMLNSLQSAESGKANETVDKILLKKRGQQRRDATLDAVAVAGGNGLLIRGLKEKKKERVADNKPYDPFGGLDLTTTRIDLSREMLATYPTDQVDRVMGREDHKIGGYYAEDYFSRALFEAFSGLGVFIDEDKVDKSLPTAAAAQAAATSGNMETDDPF